MTETIVVLVGLLAGFVALGTLIWRTRQDVNDRLNRVEDRIAGLNDKIDDRVGAVAAKVDESNKTLFQLSGEVRGRRQAEFEAQMAEALGGGRSSDD